ncbi:hypothetical protein [Nocardioides halotolerans]|uniref:hypothetical protein n=1 Tax=Nocardioides halotolerans TaxID=433660 RepID=UPI000490D733|nr:hypothetical protein [Nocardioides halotolerans]
MAWQISFQSQVLTVQASASGGTITTIEFRDRDSVDYIVRRGVSEACAHVLWRVDTDAVAGHAHLPDDYAPDQRDESRARRVCAFVDGLSEGELLQIAQTLARQEVIVARNEARERLDVLDRTSQDLVRARRALHRANLVLDALRLPPTVREAALRIADDFVGNADELRQLATHLATDPEADLAEPD